MQKMIEEVVEFISSNTEIPANMVDTSKRFDQHEIDSILMVKLIIHFEETYSVSFQERIQLEDYESIDDFIQCLEELTKEAKRD